LKLLPAQFLVTDEYVRQRIAPCAGDEFYLHLADLLTALELLADFHAPSVLDFGSGGAPYRGRFSGHYTCADLADNTNADITIGADGRLPPSIGRFDEIISTQVLEHVSDPTVYLSECKRALKRNGVLVLTTHGLFEDHRCPDDYWRWTASGLKTLVEAHGFRVEKALKITTNPRAALFALQRDLTFLSIGWRRALVVPLAFRFVRWLGLARLNRYADAHLASYRVVSEDIPGHDRYIAIGIRAVCVDER
jgi:SAM-dependent methyltransferase